MMTLNTIFETSVFQLRVAAMLRARMIYASRIFWTIIIDLVVLTRAFQLADLQLSFEIQSVRLSVIYDDFIRYCFNI